MIRLFNLVLLVSLLPIVAKASDSATIDEQIRKADALLFDTGFNQCQWEEAAKLIDEDLAFYHDQSGPSFGKQIFMENTRNAICGNPEVKPIRNAIEGSFRIFPLYNQGELYAALQQGSHDFYLKRPGQPLEKTSTARFSHLWMLRDGRWILKQVYSYDHQVPQPPTPRAAR